MLSLTVAIQQETKEHGEKDPVEQDSFPKDSDENKRNRKCQSCAEPFLGITSVDLRGSAGVGHPDLWVGRLDSDLESELPGPTVLSHRS